jgi:hypothetical protein
MAIVNKNGQTRLEIAGIDERDREVVRSDYNSENQYGPTHKDALSDGDPLGKGTGHGGHTDWLPKTDQLPSNAINYSNFDTTNGGGEYDIHGRNGIGGRERNLARQLYTPENPYSPNLINTEENIARGQFRIS